MHPQGSKLDPRTFGCLQKDSIGTIRSPWSSSSSCGNHVRTRSPPGPSFLDARQKRSLLSTRSGTEYRRAISWTRHPRCHHHISFITSSDALAQRSLIGRFVRVSVQSVEQQHCGTDRHARVPPKCSSRLYRAMPRRPNHHKRSLIFSVANPNSHVQNVEREKGARVKQHTGLDRKQEKAVAL